MSYKPARINNPTSVDPKVQDRRPSTSRRSAASGALRGNEGTDLGGDHGPAKGPAGAACRSVELPKVTRSTLAVVVAVMLVTGCSDDGSNSPPSTSETAASRGCPG